MVDFRNGTTATTATRTTGAASGVRYGRRFGAGDVVGCGLCRANDENLLAVYFVLNGQGALGVAHLIDGMEPLYAVVGMDSPALSVTVNFGAAAPFKLPDERRRHLERVSAAARPGPAATRRAWPPRAILMTTRTATSTRATRRTRSRFWGFLTTMVT